MFNEILMPLDICELDQVGRCLAVARTNVSAHGRIVLFHVLAPMPGFLASQIDQSVRDDALRSALAVLETIAKTEKLPANTVCRIESGSIARKILGHVIERASQAIVIASHTPRRTDPVFGSVAAPPTVLPG